MPLTTREKVVENNTRFEFVLWRRGKNSSQSNNHHGELTDLSREQPASLESSKQLGSEGKQQPLHLTLPKAG